MWKNKHDTLDDFHLKYSPPFQVIFWVGKFLHKTHTIENLFITPQLNIIVSIIHYSYYYFSLLFAINVFFVGVPVHFFNFFYYTKAEKIKNYKIQENNSN